MTAAEIIDKIQASVNCNWSAETVDTCKAGDPDTAVTGIATTFMSTQAVLEKAVAAGCNLVITHEPTFYHGGDDTGQLDGDAVVAAKQAYIDAHGLVVWRFHDHCHRHEPDMIVEGMVRAIGLGEPVADDFPVRFVIDPTTVGELARRLKSRLGANSVDIVGDPSMSVTRAGLSVGAPHSISQMKALRHEAVEVLIAGETREWETVPYVQDAAAQGKRKAMILLGHANSEEAGMKWIGEWLQDLVPDVPVTFIPAGDPFIDA